MWLLDKFLNKAIKIGRLIVTDHDGKSYEYGPGPEGMDNGPMRIRLTNRKAAAHIARYPQVGAGEAYMWGWLEVEPPYDIRDMVLFVTMNAKGRKSASLRPKGPLRTAAQRLLAKADSINMRGKARKNAEHIDVVMLMEVEREPAPAAADIEHLHA
jgi:cyclopropane-fatty-acyl-phospholipid synthase